MREGINGHVAAEHAALGTEHLHQRHYPRLQLLLVPIHAEDAFHGRDADTGVTASADGVQVGLPSPIAIDAKINRPAHYCDREANFWILADYVQEIGQLRGEHFQPAAQIRPLQALKTLQLLWVCHQIGPWSEAAKRIVVVPSEMLAHGSQVRKRAVEIQALRQVWIAEVNQANKRNWDFRSRSQLLRPRYLLDGILGDEFVPDEAVYLPRAGCSEIVIEKVSPWQRGVIPDKSFKSRVFPCKNTVAVGSAVVEMRVCIDDCCQTGERGSCHDRTASPSRQQNPKLENIGLGRAVSRRGRHTAPRKRRRCPAWGQERTSRAVIAASAPCPRSYRPEDIRFGMRYRDVVTFAEDGTTVADMSRIGELEPDVGEHQEWGWTESEELE